MAQRLLLADDSVTIQKVIELTFADEHIEVVAVSDGAAAVARLKTEPFDIVLADAGMPGVNGFDVATFVRDRPAGRIPVILLTGAFDPVDESRVAAVGASAVLAKPFEPQVLVSKVRELLKSGPVAASITPPAVPADAAPAADALLNAPPAAGDAPSVDDYFERLDRAFAGLNAPLEPRDPLKPSASRTHANGHAAARTAPAAPEQSTPGERNRRDREERAGRNLRDAARRRARRAAAVRVDPAGHRRRSRARRSHRPACRRADQRSRCPRDGRRHRFPHGGTPGPRRDRQDQGRTRVLKGADDVGSFWN
jgi:CheY-like chemotaxis protein